jgi:hypothetical protein
MEKFKVIFWMCEKIQYEKIFDLDTSGIESAAWEIKLWRGDINNECTVRAISIYEIENNEN